MINPIYEDMLSLSSDDGPCYVWPGNDNADRTHLIAAVREYLSENGVDVGPGENWPGNDVVVSAPTLLTWLRGWNTVKHLREHVSQEHWDTLDGICGCETLGWWCQDADGEVLVSGWSAQDVSHPEDLNMEYLDE